MSCQYQERNEELARKSAKASEEDIKTLTDEYEVRLGTSERKVYALTKERDMLKRGQEKLTSATDLVKEKDNIIAQVCTEIELQAKTRYQVTQLSLCSEYAFNFSECQGPSFDTLKSYSSCFWT